MGVVASSGKFMGEGVAIFFRLLGRDTSVTCNVFILLFILILKSWIWYRINQYNSIALKLAFIYVYIYTQVRSMFNWVGRSIG